ncbi:uncharacterized protein LOC113226726 [Hyposmocoma kahamanoa]|uniref:uncharacterized protein LOC113226726 n=1 Tax=Hyposmocoma kahamanoa TaxID=1477025 RepID=UPI000E6D7D94|nr:uncharacterized protein LOC113226726 [Hyposmocoma kahamanoa]
MRDLIFIIFAVQIYHAETSKESENIGVLLPIPATKDSKSDANFQVKPINNKNILKLYEALAKHVQKPNLPQPATKAPPNDYVKNPTVATGRPVLQLIEHSVQKSRGMVREQNERHIIPKYSTQRPQIVKSQPLPGGAVRVPITVIHSKKLRAKSRLHSKADQVVPIKMDSGEFLFMPPKRNPDIEEAKKTNFVSTKIIQSQTEMPTSQQLFLASFKREELQRQLDYIKAVKEDLLAEKLMERFRTDDSPSKRANEDKDDDNDDEDDSELTYDIDGRTNHKIF